MTFEDYKDKVFDSILISNLYNDDRERQMAVNNLKFFMDVFDFNGFFDTYEITAKDYEKYFKQTFKKHLKHKHKIVKNILKYEEKFFHESK